MAIYQYSSPTQSSRAGSADEHSPLALAKTSSHYRISPFYSLMLQRNVVDCWLRPYLSILLRSFVCDGQVRAKLGVVSTLSCSCTTSRFFMPSRVSIIWDYSAGDEDFYKVYRHCSNFILMPPDIVPHVAPFRERAHQIR